MHIAYAENILTYKDVDVVGLWNEPFIGWFLILVYTTK